MFDVGKEKANICNDVLIHAHDERKKKIGPYN